MSDGELRRPPQLWEQRLARTTSILGAGISSFGDNTAIVNPTPPPGTDSGVEPAPVLPPPGAFIAPSTPTLIPSVQGIGVVWDGLNSAGDLWPSDTSYVEVHMGTSGPTFTVGTATLKGRLARPGGLAVTGLARGTTYYFRLRGADPAGNVTTAGTAASAQPGQITAPDIAANAITANSIVAGTITGWSINAAYLSGGTISGGYITGGTVVGALVSAGTVSGAQISGGTVSGVTITGNTITGGTVNGSLVSGGTVSGALVSGGTVSGGFITGGTVDAAVYTGGAISSSTFTGGTISGSIVATGTVSGAVLSGGTVSSGYISGGTVDSSVIRTSGSGSRIIFNESVGGIASLSFYNSSNTRVMYVQAGSDRLAMFGDISNVGNTVYTTTLDAAGDIIVGDDATITGDLEVDGALSDTSTSVPNVRINTTTGVIKQTTHANSSQRFKHDIIGLDDTAFGGDIDEQLLGDEAGQVVDPLDVLTLTPIQYRRNEAPNVVVTGFLAEDVEQKFPTAATYDDAGLLETVDERAILAALLAVVKQQAVTITDLRARIEALEA